MLATSSTSGTAKLPLRLLLHLVSGSHSEPVAPARGGAVNRGYLPRKAEGGKGGGSDTPGREEEREDRRRNQQGYTIFYSRRN